MGLLTRAQIDATNDLPTEDIEVPEWHGTVRVRVMTADEQAAFFRATRQADDTATPASFAVRLVAACAIDENGEKLWPAEADLAALGKRNPLALERLLEGAMRLCKLGRFGEQAEKN